VVEDEGIGMEPELVPRVFDLFVQGQRALDRAQGGLGIGLTLVRRLVEMHGGSVTAESKGPGKGSRFTVRLPAIEPPPIGRQAQPVSHESAARPRCVLLIEDNEDARAMMKDLLQMAGHRVLEAADGAAGIALAQQVRADVAFIDIGLPGLDGYEVARRLCAAEPDRRMRLVAVTGYGSPDDARRAREAGFDEHLVKPVSADMLERVLAELGANQSPGSPGPAGLG
jgi:CheY-like chemotaxis protein